MRTSLKRPAWPFRPFPAREKSPARRRKFSQVRKQDLKIYRIHRDHPSLSSLSHHYFRPFAITSSISALRNEPPRYERERKKRKLPNKFSKIITFLLLNLLWKKEIVKTKDRNIKFLARSVEINSLQTWITFYQLSSKLQKGWNVNAALEIESSRAQYFPPTRIGTKETHVSHLPRSNC